MFKLQFNLLNLVFVGFMAGTLYSQTATAPAAGDGSSSKPYQIVARELMQSFYPLAIGNHYEYLLNSTFSGKSSINVSVTYTSDSIFPNGKKYFKKVSIEDTDTSVTFERYDSTLNHVICNSGDEQYDKVLFDFSDTGKFYVNGTEFFSASSIGDTSIMQKEFRYFNYYHHWVNPESEAFIFIEGVGLLSRVYTLLWSPSGSTTMVLSSANISGNAITPVRKITKNNSDNITLVKIGNVIKIHIDIGIPCTIGFYALNGKKLTSLVHYNKNEKSYFAELSDSRSKEYVVKVNYGNRILYKMTTDIRN